LAALSGCHHGFAGGARPGLPVTRIAEADTREIASAIDSLDGHRELYLTAAEAIWMGIAGGPERFFVAWTDDGVSAIFQARHTAPSGPDGEFIIGGVPTTLAAEYLVSKEAARSAADCFLTSSGRAANLQWEEM
jgi:hypothetical protein